jgi:hypothetical protein
LAGAHQIGSAKLNMEPQFVVEVRLEFVALKKGP